MNMNQFKTTALFGFLCLVHAGQTSAYCADPTYSSLNDYQPGGTLASQPIPVRIVSSGSLSVLDDVAKFGSTEGEGLGLSLNSIIGTVKATIRAISESSPNIRLYYAGTTTSTSVFSGANGVVIYSGGYLGNLYDGTGEQPNCSGGSCGSRIRLQSAETWQANPDDHIIWTIDPLYTENWRTGDHSLRYELLHEIGHSLGLDHLSDPCPSYGVTDDPQHLTGESDFHGVMGGGNGLSAIGYDYYRRDDIEDLIYLWGARYEKISVFISPLGSSSTWQDETTSLFSSNMYTSTPIGTSAAPMTALTTGNAIVGTSGGSYVRVSVDTGSGYSNWEYLWEGGYYARTWHRPAVVLGAYYIYVAWIEDENKTWAASRITYATKSLSSPNGWAFFHFEDSAEVDGGRYSSIGLGFDKDALRAVAILRNQNNARPKAAILDGKGTPIVEGSAYFSALGDHVSSGGKAACDIDCIVPRARVSTSGPLMCYFKGHVSGGDWVNDGLRTIGYLNFGYTDLAGSESRAFVGSIAQEGGKAYLYQQQGYSGYPASWKLFDTDYWPIAVGETTAWYFCGFPAPYWCSTHEFRAFITNQ